MAQGYAGSDTPNMLQHEFIDAALEAARAARPINDNATGVCVECEEPIPAARLRVVPGARCCVACQSGADARATRLFVRDRPQGQAGH